MTTIAGRRQDDGPGIGAGTRPSDTGVQQGSLKRSVQAAFEGMWLFFFVHMLLSHHPLSNSSCRAERGPQ